MAETKSKLKVWDNIPSWAIYALEYGIEEDPILEACLLYTSDAADE